MPDTPEPQQSNSEKKAAAKAKALNALPTVESPSILPVGTEPVTTETVEPQPVQETAAVAPSAGTTQTAVPLAPRFTLRPRHKRYALLAASVAIAAGFGAIVGAAASGSFATPKKVDVAQVALPQTTQADDKALQQTIARLSKEVATLKASVEASNKSAYQQSAKLGDRLSRDAADITGSISAPRTQPATAVPLPLAKPAPRVATTEPVSPLPVLEGWRIVDVDDGYVYVQGHGRLFEVANGTPLPGLGRVEQVKRQDDRWTVVTPKGVIVSMRERPMRASRYFD